MRRMFSTPVYVQTHLTIQIYGLSPPSHAPVLNYTIID